MEEGPLFGEAAGSEAEAQAFLAEISEEDVEVLRQREEALLQIEVRPLIRLFLPPSYGPTELIKHRDQEVARYNL